MSTLQGGPHEPVLSESAAETLAQVSTTQTLALAGGYVSDAECLCDQRHKSKSITCNDRVLSWLQTGRTHTVSYGCKFRNRTELHGRLKSSAFTGTPLPAPILKSRKSSLLFF
jgi:hypothetical protein